MTVTVAGGGWARPRLRCTLRYTAADPYAVQLCFPELGAQGDPPMWSLSRELLAAGLSRPAGEGDVVWSPRGRRRSALTLRGRHDHVTLVFRTEQLRQFLERTWQCVPAGAEAWLVDWDLLARRLCSPTR
ncbi:SsgA family sporulation/cell division regulator [Streptacidiphilus neutrinimicus]|uniref:SsgA family sporulation/cell division regulator n=1 Tax=Streptacidiphilus neutrinimicus TaxID=105420 RepID=UPI0005AA37B2|nr:SsgA family sporulation/cell division regulator [Streptacidiphilus neutrinimicus]